MKTWQAYEDDVIQAHKTDDLSDSQPTKGNIAGGLTTIEEKALGNIQKIGRKCVVDGVLDKAETPTGPGLWFMDSSSAAAEMVTLCAASGYAVHFFPTGQGNVIGNPILPVIKICANPRTVRLMSEHDFSQISITRDNRLVGSLNETHLYDELVHNAEVKSQPVETIMQPAFPFVDVSTPVDLLSTMITPQSPAVLVRDFKTDKTFIITRSDIIRVLM